MALVSSQFSVNFSSKYCMIYPVSMSRDFDILNIYYDEFKIEKMAKF